MFDQLMESLRKASESSAQMQSDMFKQWTQPWFSAPPNVPGASPEWGRTVQKRWLELAIAGMHKHREAIDSAYKAGIGVIEQAFRVAEAKSTDDARRMVEDLWHKLYDTFKSQSEAQFRELQSLAERSFEMARKAEA
jgi:hypothetical protein